MVAKETAEVDADVREYEARNRNEQEVSELHATS